MKIPHTKIVQGARPTIHAHTTPRPQCSAPPHKSVALGTDALSACTHTTTPLLGSAFACALTNIHPFLSSSIMLWRAMCAATRSNGHLLSGHLSGVMCCSCAHPTRRLERRWVILVAKGFNSGVRLSAYHVPHAPAAASWCRRRVSWRRCLVEAGTDV